MIDIGGLDPIISQLREAVIFPLVYPQLFDSAAGLYGAPKGVLLYGPPGCGKTMLAKVSPPSKRLEIVSVLTYLSCHPELLGLSQGIRCYVYQYARFDDDGQVVWRVQQNCRSPLLPGQEITAQYHLHR